MYTVVSPITAPARQTFSARITKVILLLFLLSHGLFVTYGPAHQHNTPTDAAPSFRDSVYRLVHHASYQTHSQETISMQGDDTAIHTPNKYVWHSQKIEQSALNGLRR